MLKAVLVLLMIGVMLAVGSHFLEHAANADSYAWWQIVGGVIFYGLVFKALTDITLTIARAGKQHSVTWR